MEIIQILLHIGIMLTAIPIGWLLAWLTRDELVDGKRWFNLIIYALILILIVMFFVWRDISIILALIYMVVVTVVSLYKGGDKKFTR